MDDQTIIEIWDTFKEFIPENMRQDAADQFVNFLVEVEDVDTDTFDALLGYDPHLDSSITSHLDDVGGGDDEEDEEDFWGDDEEEDEDY